VSLEQDFFSQGAILIVKQTATQQYKLATTFEAYTTNKLAKT